MILVTMNIYGGIKIVSGINKIIAI